MKQNSASCPIPGNTQVFHPEHHTYYMRHYVCHHTAITVLLQLSKAQLKRDCYIIKPVTLEPSIVHGLLQSTDRVSQVGTI